MLLAHHKRLCGAYVNAPQTALAVKVIETTVEHGCLTAVFSESKLKYHVGTGAVAKTAVNTLFGKKERDISFS
jgi:hypothetical protein